METWLATSPWTGMILWIFLYTSDYYLTIYSARGFKTIGHFQFEGSYELTPQFQKDVDSLKPVSKRHLFLLVAYSLLILLLWWLTRYLPYGSWAYLLYLGMFLLIEVVVHLRHFRNAFLVREVDRHGGVNGQIMYRKWFSYRISSFEFHLYAGFFLLIAALTYSLFFLGGSIMCFGTGIKHGLMAKREKRISLQAAGSK